MKTSICNIQVQVRIPVEFDEEGKPLGFIMNAIAPQLDNLTWENRSDWLGPEEIDEKLKILGPINLSEFGHYHSQKEIDVLMHKRQEEIKERKALNEAKNEFEKEWKESRESYLAQRRERDTKELKALTIRKENMEELNILSQVKKEWEKAWKDARTLKS